MRSRLLTTLGFTLPEEIDEIAGNQFGGNLSMERADLLDVDVIVWIDPQEAEGELGGPVYQSLPVHTQGREVLLSSYDDPVGSATSFISVLSLPFLLDNLTPMLVAAMGGDPATAARQTDSAESTPAFPVTIEHKFGSVTIPAEPQRVIALGYSEVDPILALGVKPIAVREWFGESVDAGLILPFVGMVGRLLSGLFGLAGYAVFSVSVALGEVGAVNHDVVSSSTAMPIVSALRAS